MIELMVALVVGGLLMAVLVGVAGSVQKTFGRTRDVTELQANLRFAMRALVQDFRRTAFMYYPDPDRDPGRWGPRTSVDVAITEITDGTGMLALRGNYISSRDYRVALDSSNQATVLCRNGDDYRVGPSGQKECIRLGSYEPYLEPFNDGPGMAELFCGGVNELIRLDTGDQRYMYLHVSSADDNTNQITFSESVNRDMVMGAARNAAGGLSDMHGLWVSPVTTVVYNLMDGGSPPPYGSFGTVRWVLNRTTTDCRARPMSELVEFMLPPVDQEADAPGFMLQLYSDANWGEGTTAGPWVPSIDFDNPVDFPGGPAVEWPKVRAVGIVLRARTEVEDANFVLQDYPSAAAKNFGYDLDQNPDNGLAHVRVERTMVELRNMAAADSPANTP